MSSALHNLNLRAQQWNVRINNTRETPTSIIAFGERDSLAVVLKISKGQSDESRSGEVLRAYNGDGTVRVYESHVGAVLLERLEPGRELVELVRQGRDERATKILVEVLKDIAGHAPPADCPTVFDWARGFDRYIHSGDRQIDPLLVSEARKLYCSLAASQKITMLLHGDLHHYNVLLDSNRGWVAIDPKGVVGELEYEIGAIIRNPVEQPDFVSTPAVVERRLRVVTDALQLNYRRALEWCFAQAVLSAIWGVEDGYQIRSDDAGLKLARAIKPMLDPL